MAGIWRAALVPVLLTATGCASAGGAGAQGSVTRFYDDYAQRDGAAACALLTPGARQAVAEAAHETCARAVLRERLPRVGAVRATQVYGDQAQVHLRGDTAFVARLDGGWRVRAVGCTPRPGAPYDCEVEDGG